MGLLGMQMAIPSRVYQWNGLGASGSLSAIITFYLIVPLLRKIITSRQRAFIILGGGVIICELAFILMSTLLVFYGESGHWLPYFCPQTNIWYFLIGIALWWIKDQVKQIHILIFAIGAFCAIIVKGYDSYSFFALCTALALCVYWKYGSIKLRKNKIITSLNRISYAFWLVHPIVVRLISVHIGIYLKHAAGVEYVEWLAVLVLSIMGSILLTEITSKRGGFVVMLRNSINDDIGGER